jgi:hypothetical protein
MRHRVVALFDRCRLTPFSKLPKLTDEMTFEESEKVAALLIACGDSSRASLLRKRRVDVPCILDSTKAANKRHSLEKLLEDVKKQTSVKGMLHCKKTFDEALLTSPAPSYDIVEKAYQHFELQRLRCSNRHREKLVDLLIPRGQWERAVQIVSACRCPSTKEVEFVLGCDGVEWSSALAFAMDNVQTSKSSSLAAAIASRKGGWELSLRIVGRGPPLSPRDGFDVQQALLAANCSWEACLRIMRKLTSCGRKNTLMFASHLVRHCKIDDALAFLQICAPLPSDWIGFMVKQAELSSNELALFVLERLRSHCTTDEVALTALSVLLGDHSSATKALASNLSDKSVIVRWLSAHASCDGTESFEVYRSAHREGKYCKNPAVASKFGEVARELVISNEEEQQLCAAATKFLNPLAFWKSFSRL